MPTIYLCCDTTVPEVSKLTLDQAVEQLRYRFDEYLDDPDGDHAIETRIRESLQDIKLGYAGKDIVPDTVIWAVADADVCSICGGCGLVGFFAQKCSACDGSGAQ